MKKIPIFLFKFVMIVLFCIFGLWLIQMVYFPQLEAKKVDITPTPDEKEDLFGHILKHKEPAPQSH